MPDILSLRLVDAKPHLSQSSIVFPEMVEQGLMGGSSDKSKVDIDLMRLTAFVGCWLWSAIPPCFKIYG
jgi:hypothetical protein